MSGITKDFLQDIAGKVGGQSDLDWSEICELHKVELAPDTVRKAGLGIKWANDLGMLKLGADTEDGKQCSSEMRIAAQKFYDQRREYNKLLIQQARDEMMTDALVAAANRLNETKPLRVEPRGFASINSEHEAVVVFSDWHYGQISCNIFNEYSPEICRERLKRVVREVAMQCEYKHPRVLHVVLLGDMIEGCLRASSRVASSELACDQIMHVAELIAEAVAYFCDVAPRIRIYSTYGNHGRMVQKYEDSIHSDNAERLIPWWIRQRFSGTPGIEVVEDNFHELIYFECCGEKICATHGDLDKEPTSAWKLDTILQNHFGTGVDHLILGHMHEYKTGDAIGKNVVCCGSLCGADEYAKNKRLFSRPSQLLLMFRDGYGLESVSEILAE